MDEDKELKFEIRLDKLVEKIDAIENSYWTLIDKLEQRIETSEMMLAQMVPAFGELASVVQVITDTLATGTPEEKETFRQQLLAARKDMIDLLSYASKKNEDTSN